MRNFGVESIRQFAGRPVRVRLVDGTGFSGIFRTEILSAQSVSVYVTHQSGEGVTLYIDQIAEIVPDDSEE